MKVPKLILAAMVCVVAASPSTAQTCVNPPSGLVGWWPGDGNAGDISGNNNHGTLTNGATFATGEVDQGFLLSGTTYVDLPDSPILELTTGLTLEAWISPSDVSNNRQIISKFGTSGNYAYQIGLSPGGALRADVSGNGTIYDLLVSPAGVLSAGTFAHVATTFDHGTWTLYVNGNVVASKTSAVTSIYSGGTTKPSIGRDPASIQYFQGIIDEATIYNRALSASEVQGIHNAGSLGKCKAPPAPDAPGSVPSDDSASGTPFTIGKGAGGTLNLFWSPSCTGMATNYAVYQGTLPINGTYTHAALNCSLGNTTTANISPGAGSKYYLLVPETAASDGMYGVNKMGGIPHPIPAAVSACHPQMDSFCIGFFCPGADPSTGHCTGDAQCTPLFCDHTACTPTACYCEISGQWICDTDCNGHCA